MVSAIGRQAMRAARRVRQELGLDLDGPLPDLLEVVEGRGGAHVVVLRLGEAVAGAYLQRPGLALLCIDGGQALVRQRFTLAHEFGHHRLGHASVIDRPVDLTGAARAPSEVAANYFAAEFLMPEPAVRRLGVGRTIGLDDVVRLAVEYGVSAKMARIRLETSGALTDRRRAARLDVEIEADMHRELAARLGLRDLDDALARAAASMPRVPPALRGSALGGLLAGELGLDEAAARSGREPAQLSRALTRLGLDRLVPARCS